MRVRASDEMSMGHADKLDVVDVTAFAGDETLVFLAQHACANALDTHRIPPCRTAHLREKLWARRPQPVIDFRNARPCRSGIIPQPVRDACGRRRRAPI